VRSQGLRLQLRLPCAESNYNLNHAVIPRMERLNAQENSVQSFTNVTASDNARLVTSMSVNYDTRGVAGQLASIVAESWYLPLLIIKSPSGSCVVSVNQSKNRDNKNKKGG